MFSMNDIPDTPHTAHRPTNGRPCLFLRLTDYKAVIKKVFCGKVYPDITTFSKSGLKTMYCEKPSLGHPNNRKWLDKEEIYANLADYMGMGEIIEITEVMDIVVDSFEEKGVLVFYKNKKAPIPPDDETDIDEVEIDENTKVYEAEYSLTATFTTAVFASSEEEARQKADLVFKSTDFGQAEKLKCKKTRVSEYLP